MEEMSPAGGRKLTGPDKIPDKFTGKRTNLQTKRKKNGQIYGQNGQIL